MQKLTGDLVVMSQTLLFHVKIKSHHLVQESVCIYRLEAEWVWGYLQMVYAFIGNIM